MKKFIREQFAKDEKLLHHSAIIMAGSFIANALNYLYQLFMGRMLGPEDFGVLGALFALMYVATFSLGTIRVVITQFTAQYMTANHPEKVKTLLTIGSFNSLAKYYAYVTQLCGFKPNKHEGKINKITFRMLPTTL